ncbi:hypothetical protein [Salmonella phage SSBI34]|nr:hypothetical protein [Salmonella phage SSBI34]
MKPLTKEDEVAFRKYWKTLKKDHLMDKMWEMLQFMAYQQHKNDELEEQLARSNTQCMGNCRSVGGVTLPPGV